jgi:hypothetical protein
MKRAAVIAFIAILALALLASRHVVSGTTMFIFVMLAVAVLVFLLIHRNLKPRS